MSAKRKDYAITQSGMVKIPCYMETDNEFDPQQEVIDIMLDSFAVFYFHKSLDPEKPGTYLQLPTDEYLFTTLPEDEVLKLIEAAKQVASNADPFFNIGGN
jgi:hypothetical protein